MAAEEGEEQGEVFEEEEVSCLVKAITPETDLPTPAARSHQEPTSPTTTPLSESVATLPTSSLVTSSFSSTCSSNPT